MKQLILLLIAMLLFSSCEKEELTGDTEFLIGTWEWVFTREWDNKYSYWHYEYPSEEKYVNLEFIKKGYLNINFSGEIKRHRISSIVFDESQQKLHINLNNQNNNKYISGYFTSQDTIFFKDFPTEFRVLPGYFVEGYFVKK